MSRSPRYPNDATHLHVNELASRVVAQSGRPEDRFHLGKLILQSFKDAPDFIMQIDGSTGESVTFAQGLERSVRCATAFRNLGLLPGDVMVLMSPNYSDLAAAFYAALYLGVVIAPVDMSLAVLELKYAFEVNNPKIIFCKSDKATDVTEALKTVNEKTLIVTFDQGDKYMSYQEFIKKYSDDSAVEDFKPNDFDPEETTSMFITTSGTTGLPKAAAVSHKNYAIAHPYLWSRFTNFPTPTRLAMVCTTLQWMTAVLNYLASPIMRFTRLHSERPLTVDHAYHLINTYKPTFTIMSPTLLINLINPETRHKCDFSSFEVIFTGGSAVHQELLGEVEKVMPSCETSNCYGMSELSGAVFHPQFPSRGSCGTPVGCFQYRSYYNNPEATKASITEDGWFKSGDLFYRDEHWNFYFVDRMKLLLKYKNYQISPVEVESVILQHPGVRDVVVVGIPDISCGELPTAFVVRKTGSNVSAQEIKDMVKSLLSDAKQLRGGVIFMDAFPTTATSKVHRMKLKEMALTMDRE
ncbi:luciferin 4-monooxygenase-like isoform X2 [Plodia interpunctella]|uniref:luciferin 4-monooxygenase-like isoform X2 n=1 Tax=Plodia interpunctella TaxID=58824 RepID=UPI002367BD60|nr:luciferin 4-monooxygenase-like isoform X2 [Plodia interpunctella]